jgi:hypothetical protein
MGASSNSISGLFFWWWWNQTPGLALLSEVEVVLSTAFLKLS